MIQRVALAAIVLLSACDTGDPSGGSPVGVEAPTSADNLAARTHARAQLGGEKVRVADVPFERQPRGPGCLAAAAAMVLRALGEETSALEVMRSVPVWPDGIALFDIQEHAHVRGLQTRVFNGRPGDLATLLGAGLPVITLVHEGAAQRVRHATVVVGLDADRVERHDPATPLIGSEPRVAFEQRFASAGSAALVIWRDPPALPAELQSRMEQANGRFRAVELARRAEEHLEANPQKVALYRRAIAEAPQLPELHNNLAVTLAALGSEDLARDALREALAADPGFDLARTNLVRLDAHDPLLRR